MTAGARGAARPPAGFQGRSPWPALTTLPPREMREGVGQVFVDRAFEADGQGGQVRATCVYTSASVAVPVFWSTWQ